MVIEEMEAEGYHPHDNTHHYWEPDEKNRKIVRKVSMQHWNVMHHLLDTSHLKRGKSKYIFYMFFWHIRIVKSI